MGAPGCAPAGAPWLRCLPQSPHPPQADGPHRSSACGWFPSARYPVKPHAAASAPCLASQTRALPNQLPSQVLGNRGDAARPSCVVTRPTAITLTSPGLLRGLTGNGTSNVAGCGAARLPRLRRLCSQGATAFLMGRGENVGRSRQGRSGKTSAKAPWENNQRLETMSDSS